MKPGDIIIPAARGDGSSVVAAVAGGAAWRCPSMSRRGSPPPSSAIAVEKLPLGTYDAVAGAAGGLPVSRCTTVMNSCGLAWMTMGVCSYTITGCFLVVVDGALLDVVVGGDEPRDGDDDDTFSGSGRVPRRPPAARLEGDDDASEEGLAAAVMVMAASCTCSKLLDQLALRALLDQLATCALRSTRSGAVQRAGACFIEREPEREMSREMRMEASVPRSRKWRCDV